MNICQYPFFFLLTLFCYGVGGLSPAAAQTIFQGFEDNPCTTANGTADAFYDGCVPDWIATSGTPNIQDVEVPQIGGGLSAAEGDFYARTYTGIWATCSGQPRIGESMALEHPFKECVPYQLSFKMAKRTFDPAQIFSGEHPVKISVALANGLSNVAPVGICDYPQLTVGSGMVVVGEYNYPASGSDQNPIWSTRNASFTPDRDFSHLIFIPQYLGSGVGGVNVFYDDFVMTEGNAPQYPSISTAGVEDLSVEKTEFCHNEDVWVCLGDADFSWTNTQFSIYEGTSTTVYSETGEVPGVSANNCYNLSELLRAKGSPALQADQTYRIRMSIEHPSCGVVEVDYPITVVCCEENIDVTFSYDIDQRSLPLSITAQANTDHTPDGGIHTFCLYVDYDSDGVEDGQVMCSNGINFSSISLNPSLSFILEHCVETACGKYCRRIVIRNCGLFPCREVCDINTAWCQQDMEGTEISWEPGLHSESYEVEVVVNDPECDCEGSSSTWTFTTNGRSIRFPQTPDCFSYRVKAICNFLQPDGTLLREETWTDSQCASCGSAELGGGQGDPRSAATERLAAPSIQVSPNPFSSEFYLQLDGVDARGADVEIYTMDGKLIYRQTPLRSSLIDLSQTSHRGLLLLKVELGERRFYQKILRQ